MGTDIRPTISDKSRYWISKHRYYELKHFCLQYPEWKEAYCCLEAASLRSTSIVRTSTDIHTDRDQTAQLAMRRIYFSDRIELVEQTAMLTDPSLVEYILLSVTKGYTYTYMQTTMDIPCGKDLFYDRYRKFFWLLSQRR